MAILTLPENVWFGRSHVHAASAGQLRGGGASDYTRLATRRSCGRLVVLSNLFHGFCYDGARPPLFSLARLPFNFSTVDETFLKDVRHESAQGLFNSHFLELDCLAGANALPGFALCNYHSQGT